VLALNLNKLSSHCSKFNSVLHTARAGCQKGLCYRSILVQKLAVMGTILYNYHSTKLAVMIMFL